MKVFRKIAVFVLALAMLFSIAACNDSNGQQSGNNQQTEDDYTGYTNPKDLFSTYDNIDYNEYLMGEKTTIENQWPGYGIGDPFVMRFNGKYYLYCSSLDSEIGVRGYESADLVQWQPLTGEGLRDGYVSYDAITAAAYAPEVYYFNGKFYMYTSPAGRGHYVLTADKPEGPFVKATDNFGLSIDGSVLIDDDEQMYFTYASDNGIIMARMNDMLSVNTSKLPLLLNTSIGGWTEGPYILKRDGIYYLTFTGNHVASDGYRIAYATANTLEGGYDYNFTRAVNNPLALGTETELKGIGHSSTVLGPDMDSHYLVYHYLNSSGGPNRSLGIDRLTFNGTMMSVGTTLEGSVKPTLPEFYALGSDGEKFDTAGEFMLGKESANADFTAEFNITGNAENTFVFGYADENNYCSVTVNLTDKTVKLHKTESGTQSEIAAGALVNDFAPNALHTVRVSVRGGKADVVFDNMTKIDNAALSVRAGKIGYKSVGSAVVGYTAFSNVAMGMSDEREAKQAAAFVGASNYLTQNTHNEAFKLGDNSGVETIEDDAPFTGVKKLVLGERGDYASYLVKFPEKGRYGMEMVYNAADCGKKIKVQIGSGEAKELVLPALTSTEDTPTAGEYLRAMIGSFDRNADYGVVKIESATADEVGIVAFRFARISEVSPEYEQSLANYAEKGADYKTIWKLKDGGHYAKAGTRQLVYFGDNTITDFTLEAEIKLEGASGTSTAGIVFRADNYAASTHDSYRSIQGYYLSINNSLIRMERLNYADGFSQIAVAESNPFTVSDTFYKIKIEARGNNIKVWADGALVMQVTDSWAFTHGKIGLYTNGAAAIFRNLKITA